MRYDHGVFVLLGFDDGGDEVEVGELIDGVAVVGPGRAEFHVEGSKLYGTPHDGFLRGAEVGEIGPDGVARTKAGQFLFRVGARR